MNAPRTPSETLSNLLHYHNGTATPGIMPARRAILSILQSVRPTACADDTESYLWFYNSGREFARNGVMVGLDAK